VDLMRDLLVSLGDAAGDVLPVAVFMLFFHVVVLRQPLVHARNVFVGLALVIVGLALLLLGVERALFPTGRMMVGQLSPDQAPHGAEADFWSFHLVYLFAFCIAFTAAIAEPALLATARRVNEISGGAINALGLRAAAAFGVGAGVTLGCARIVAGIPLHWCLAGVFSMIFVQTLTAPRVIRSFAYDSGGVSTTVITVPVVAALGLGLAELIPGRDPLLDGFGLIALAASVPAITVLGYAQCAALLERFRSRRNAAGANDRAGKED
jgi:hypothetical protein